MLTLARITPEHFDIIFLNENHDWCSLTFFTCFQDNCFESHQNVSCTLLRFSIVFFGVCR
jgi:hypothetical protein